MSKGGAIMNAELEIDKYGLKKVYITANDRDYIGCDGKVHFFVLARTDRKIEVGLCWCERRPIEGD